MFKNQKSLIHQIYYAQTLSLNRKYYIFENIILKTSSLSLNNL
jgi:hypothetical protein